MSSANGPGSQQEADEDLRQLHPAVLGAMWRRGRVGGREATATIIHLISLGFLTSRAIEVQGRAWGRSTSRKVIELQLVPGRATANHRSHGNPVIRQGHIEGICRIDRELLSLVFDGIAHSDRVALPQIDAFSARHRYAYWTAISKWRRLVREEAQHKRVDTDGGVRIPRRDLRRLRMQVRDALRTGQTAGNIGAIGVALGLEREVANAFRLPQGVRADASPSPGSDSTPWLLRGGYVHSMGSAFSPYYSSGYAPVTVGVTLPTYGTGGGSSGGGGGGFSGGGGDGGGGGGGGAG